MELVLSKMLNFTMGASMLFFHQEKLLSKRLGVKRGLLELKVVSILKRDNMDKRLRTCVYMTSFALPFFPK